VPASIVQISISRGGMPKRPVPEGEVTTLGIDGDGHAHTQIHGGLNQALLLITAEGIDDLIAQGFPLFFGALGENLTSRGLDRRALRTGQRYRTPNVVFELTKPRAPCDQLNIYGARIQHAMYDALIKAGDPSSPRWGLGGFYASVVQSGTIRLGDPLTLLDELA
jgi:MOSC domain-containing protein YiiM